MRVVTQNQGKKRSGRGRLFQNEVHLWKLNIYMVAQVVKNLPAVLETWVQSLGQEDPLEKEMAPTTVFLPGEFHGQRLQSMGSQRVGHY